MGRPEYREFEQRTGEQFRARPLNGDTADTWTLLKCKLLDTPDLPDTVEDEWFQLTFATEERHTQGTFRLTSARDSWTVELFAVPEADRRMCVSFS